MGLVVVQVVWGCGVVISFLLMLRRFVQAVVGAWKGDAEFRSLAYLVLITLASGTIFYSSVEGWSVVDAFYFSVTTLTTVGLGDLAPSTKLGKLFTVLYIFVGIGIIAGFVTTLTKEALTSGGVRGRNGAGEETAPGS